MKKNPIFPYMLMSLFALAVFLGGCFGTSQNAKFYTLNSLNGEGVNPQEKATESCLTLGLGPVLFPMYMVRPQIVTRSGPNQVQINEFHRWASPVDNHIRNVLRENLAALLTRDRVVLYPWKGNMPVDYRVEININRFDGKPGDSITLGARWRISGPEGIKVLLTRTSTITEPLKGTDYESLVSGKSRALADLSREIAKAIGTLAPCPASP
jgi:uncharacterized lipoprotein YmbA